MGDSDRRSKLVASACRRFSGADVVFHANDNADVNPVAHANSDVDAPPDVDVYTDIDANGNANRDKYSGSSYLDRMSREIFHPASRGARILLQ